ncbi:hypothetical protein D6764_00115 [Candidatus Woesearchaeota archaeon]|nr:MAG: hypothetical protein D6764_00115 [Candidatus Woesearchaeota archaeon]
MESVEPTKQSENLDYVLNNEFNASDSLKESYDSLESSALKASVSMNGVDPYSSVRLQAFRRLSEAPLFFDDPQLQERYSRAVSELLLEAADFYSTLGSAGLMSNNYDAKTGMPVNGNEFLAQAKEKSDLERKNLAAKLLSFSEEVWASYEDSSEITALEESYDPNMELGPLVADFIELNTLIEQAMASPEYEVAVSAYLAARALDSSLNVATSTSRGYESLFTVAMRDPDYNEVLRFLTTEFRLHGNELSPLTSPGGSRAGQRIYRNNW